MLPTTHHVSKKTKILFIFVHAWLKAFFIANVLVLSFIGNSSTKICSTTPGTKDYNCVKDNERRYLNKLHRICSHCKYTCNELTYNAEITSAKLQSKSILWASKNETKLDW